MGLSGILKLNNGKTTGMDEPWLEILGLLHKQLRIAINHLNKKQEIHDMDAW